MHKLHIYTGIFLNIKIKVIVLCRKILKKGKTSLSDPFQAQVLLYHQQVSVIYLLDNDLNILNMSTTFTFSSPILKEFLRVLGNILLTLGPYTRTLLSFPARRVSFGDFNFRSSTPFTCLRASTILSLYSQEQNIKVSKIGVI